MVDRVIALCPQGMVCLLSPFFNALISELPNQFPVPRHKTHRSSLQKSSLRGHTFPTLLPQFELYHKDMSFVKLIPEVSARNLSLVHQLILYELHYFIWALDHCFIWAPL